MRRSLIAGTVALLVIGIALPHSGESAGLAQKGKGGGKKEEKIVVAQMTLHDEDPDARVRSDGRIRQDPLIDEIDPIGLPDFDADLDGFGDLAGPFQGIGPIVYQDHRISFADSGDVAYPDPCSGFDIETGGRNAGRVTADMDRGAGDVRVDGVWDDAFRECAVFVDPSGAQPFLDDARTLTLVFDKTDPGAVGGDPYPGLCACNKFAYLATYGKTTFVDAGSTCSLTLAAGPIDTDSGQVTSNPKIIAFPFREAGKKGKGGSSSIPDTSVHINFRVDRLPGEENQWLVWSQDENIPVTGDADTRIITSTDQLFDLKQPGETFNTPACTGFQMRFQMEFKRFEVPAGNS